MKLELVDSHVHVWSPDLAAYPRTGPLAGIDPRSFTPEQLLAVARPCGVSRIVLVQISFYQQDHRYLLQALERYPGVFSGIALADLAAPHPANEMRRFARLGVRGIRIPASVPSASWLDSAAMRELWRRAADERLAVCLLTNPSELPGIGRMCERFPHTTVVIDHLARIGALAAPADAEVASLCALAVFPRVSVKVSAFSALGAKQPPYTDLEPMIEKVIRAFGAGRCMWGSDSPFQLQPPHTYRASVELVRDHLNFLTPTERSWLLGRTAAGIFFPGAAAESNGG